MILNIKKYPDTILRRPAREVKKIDSEIIDLFDNMVVTMRNANGIGIAGPQIGVDLQIIVVDTDKGVRKLMNPKLVKKSKWTSIFEEGCLSLPNIHVKIKRPKEITVSALNIDGNIEMIEADGLLAHILQHEIDHLKGRLIIDYLPFFKRLFMKRWQKLAVK